MTDLTPSKLPARWKFEASRTEVRERHIYRLVDAAEIGLQIGTNQLVSQPPESQLRPLKSVPEEERKAISSNRPRHRRFDRRARECGASVPR